MVGTILSLYNQAMLPFLNHERRWVWIFCGFVILLSCLPYFIAWGNQDARWVYTGTLFASDDTNSYIAYVRRGALGEWLFRTPYTVVPQQGALVFFPYYLAGKPAALFNLRGADLQAAATVLFHLFRVLASLIAIHATYDFLALFIKETSMRRFATVLATLGGGLGFIGLIPGKLAFLPLEFYSPEAFGFMGIFGIPHLTLAYGSLLWSVRAYLLAGQPRGVNPLKGILVTGGFWALTFLAQPLTGIIAIAIPVFHLAIMATWQGIRKLKGQPVDWDTWKNYARQAAGAAFLVSPLVLYTLIALRSDPYLRVWSTQANLAAPALWVYLVTYGLVLPLATWGANCLLKKQPWQAALLMIWVVGFTAAVYIPYSQRRRLIEGVWVALLALAFVGLEELRSRSDWSVIKLRLPKAPFTKPSLPYPSRKLMAWLSPGRILTAGLAISFLTPLIFYAGLIQQSQVKTPPLFLPADRVAAYLELDSRAQSGDAVLAAYSTSNALPAWTSLRVVMGNSTISVDPLGGGTTDLLSQQRQFFGAIGDAMGGVTGSAMDDTQRQALLKAWGVQYVIWGPEERALGGWDPRQAGFLSHLFQKGEIDVFSVIN